MFDLEYRLEPVCRLTFSVTGRDVVGLTPQGLRSVGYIGEGLVEGPRIRGAVLPGGADWACMRTDGVMEIDVRVMIRTHDDATIQFSYTGVVDFGPDQFDRSLAGVPPTVKLRPRSAPRMIAHNPEYLWVNRHQFIGIGELRYGSKTEIVYDVYAIE